MFFDRKHFYIIGTIIKKISCFYDFDNMREEKDELFRGVMKCLLIRFFWIAKKPYSFICALFFYLALNFPD